MLPRTTFGAIFAFSATQAPTEQRVSGYKWILAHSYKANEPRVDAVRTSPMRLTS